MKTKLLLTIGVLATALSACTKEVHSVIVIQDCTGTYLRWNSKDYHVCNVEKTDAFANGTAVKASFKKIENCNGAANDRLVCYRNHDNEGWIEVEKIK